MPGRKFRPNIGSGSRPSVAIPPSRPSVPSIDKSNESGTDTMVTTEQSNPAMCTSENVTSSESLPSYDNSTVLNEGRMGGVRCHDDTVVSSSPGKTSWVRKKVAPKIPPAGKSRKRTRTNSETTSDVGMVPTNKSMGVVPVHSSEDVRVGVASDDSVGVVRDDVPMVLQEPMQLDVASNVEVSVMPPIDNDIHQSDCTTNDHQAMDNNDIHEETTTADNNIHKSITTADDIHEEVESEDRSESVSSSVSKEGEGKDSRCKKKRTRSSDDSTPPKRRKKKTSTGSSSSGSSTKGKGSQFREAPDRSKMTMQELIYYNPSANPMSSSDKGKGASGKSTQDAGLHGSGNGGVALEPEEDEGRLVPQLKLDIDGNIVIDEKSMVVESSRSELDLDNIVTEDGTYTTSTSFRNKHKIKKWTKQETCEFYKALTQVGTDFTMMTLLLPKRTRKELKNKFKKEEKSNSTRISNALCKLCVPSSSAATTIAS